MGFDNLPCIKCGEEACITLRLDSFDEDDSLHCVACEVDFSRADVARTIAAWGPVLAWLDTCPKA